MLFISVCLLLVLIYLCFSQYECLLSYCITPGGCSFNMEYFSVYKSTKVRESSIVLFKVCPQEETSPKGTVPKINVSCVDMRIKVLAEKLVVNANIVINDAKSMNHV